MVAMQVEPVGISTAGVVDVLDVVVVVLLVASIFPDFLLQL